MVIAEQQRPLVESETRPGNARTRVPASAGAAPGPARAELIAAKRNLLILTVVAVFILCMFYIYQTTRVIALSYQAEKTRISISELQRQNAQMELKIAELQAPERVQRIATTKLGMKEPQNFMIASYSSEQLASQSTQVEAASPAGSWSRRLLAAIPKFIGLAEASPR